MKKPLQTTIAACIAMTMAAFAGEGTYPILKSAKITLSDQWMPIERENPRLNLYRFENLNKPRAWISVNRLPKDFFSADKIRELLEQWRVSSNIVFEHGPDIDSLMIRDVPAIRAMWQAKKDEYSKVFIQYNYLMPDGQHFYIVLCVPPEEEYLEITSEFLATAQQQVSFNGIKN